MRARRACSGVRCRVAVALITCCVIARAATANPENPSALPAQPRPAATASVESATADGQVRSALALADTQLEAGDLDGAVVALERALAALPTGHPQEAILKARLGGAYLRAGDDVAARELLVAALGGARRQGRTALAAAVLNDLGILHGRAGEVAAAREAYDEARRLADDIDDAGPGLRALLNAAALERDRGEPDRALALALAVPDTVRRLDGPAGRPAHDLIWASLVLSDVARTTPRLRRESGAAANTMLREALRIADALGDATLRSAANGVLGGLYRVADRPDEALTLTRRAVFEAQRAGASDLLFRWHWQAARVHRARDEREHALAALGLALSVYEGRDLAPPALALPWDEPGHRMYVELADLLLQRSAAQPSPADAQRDLVAARDAMEKRKAGELQDYFRDSCVAEARAAVAGVTQTIDPGTAVLYPIVLPDRLELLLDLGAGIERFTVPVSEADVVTTAREFRTAVESRRTRAYRASARTLHDWLVAPLLAELVGARVETLVVAPDRALRTIPIAALHDGERFVIDRFAVTLVPSLELIDPRPLPLDSAQSLLVGLSEPVQGYPALPYVDTELGSISAHFAGRTLKNAEFVRGTLEQALVGTRFNIAHIASHGVFSGDVRASFVLTHDGQVSVDELARFIGFNRFRDDPLDLLTLSACQTAAGDEQAALGLAGITVKAGARSALATLWPVHDEATALLMSDFYSELGTARTTKARALQQAQQRLRSLTRYRHPGYWAGFVLIGNWH